MCITSPFFGAACERETKASQVLVDRRAGENNGLVAIMRERTVKIMP